MTYYRMDNMPGYTQEELDTLNAELEERLADTEPYTDAWYEIIKHHADEVGKR